MNQENYEYKCTECGCSHEIPLAQHEDLSLFHECGCGAPLLSVDPLWKTKFERRFREVLGSFDIGTDKIEKRIELNWQKVTAYDFSKNPTKVADAVLKHYLP